MAVQLVVTIFDSMGLLGSYSGRYGSKFVDGCRKGDGRDDGNSRIRS